MRDSRFLEQAKLVLEVLPYIWDEKEFALKGGTAINFFYRNLLRLSIDIDLTFLPILDRDTSLEKISMGLQNISERIRSNSAIKVFEKTSQKNIVGLIVKKDDWFVKVEPNLVIRGTVYPTERRALVEKSQQLFEQKLYFNCLSMADLYGGKICAALDRQHPRDLFDIKVLLEHEGVTDQIRKAFVVYLISHSRPMIELLNPNFIEIDSIYENEFKGMTEALVSFEALKSVREKLVRTLRQDLTDDERQFLLSVKNLKPDWNLMGVEHIKELPAVKWKMKNLEKMNKKKHKQAVDKLRDYLEI